MKAYVLTTGVLFALVTVAHVLRMFEEGRGAMNPWYVAITLVTAGLAVWAWRVARTASRAS